MPLQILNSTILDVHTSENIVSYIDPSDQYVIKEARLTRTNQSLLFQTTPIYISVEQKQRSEQKLEFLEGSHIISNGQIFDDMLAFVIQESNQNYLLIRKRHMNQYSSMWFELSNRIDNMKFIFINSLPRISFDNVIKYEVSAMLSLFDQQTNQHVIFATTQNIDQNEERMDQVLHQITFPRPYNNK